MQGDRPRLHISRTDWTRWLPGLRTLGQYESSWLRHDVVAGLVMTTMLVPVGIAYAEASGVPGINGLYATIVPLLAYAVFGPSRILVLGPDSALAPVILAVVLPLSAGDPERAVAAAAMMAIVSGVVCVAAGLARLGFITELLSKPIRYGYMNGIAITVILSQVPKLLGFSVNAAGPVRQARGIVESVLAGNTNPVALGIGGGALALILVLKRWPRVPGMLIAVRLPLCLRRCSISRRVPAWPCSGHCRRACRGHAFRSCPSESLAAILMGGVAVALVSFADTSVLSRTYAARLRTPVDPNQEMTALGIANLATGLLSGHANQQQLLAHTGRRGSRRQDTTDRGRRRARHRVAADARSRLASGSAADRSGGSRHRVSDRAVRSVRSAPYLSHSALGVLAVDDLHCRRGGVRRHSRALRSRS